MSSSKLAQVLLGVLGVWLIAGAIDSLPAYLYFWLGGSPPQAIRTDWARLMLVPVVQVAVSLGVGVFVFWNREALGGRIVGADDAPASGITGMQAPAFAVVGAFFVVKGLSICLPAIVTRAFAPTNVDLWRGATEAAVGLVLFLGARRLANLWTSLPTSGSAR